MTGVHVRVGVGVEQYALPVEHVREVVEVGDVTPVPGTADGVIGLRNLGGEIVPALDLAQVLHVANDGSPRRLVVVEHRGRRTALAVNEVIDVGPIAGELETHESPHLRASAVVDGEMVGVLDLDVVLADASEQDAQ
jgi:purine-binding chemotaxis protein CheW